MKKRIVSGRQYATFLRIVQFASRSIFSSLRRLQTKGALARRRLLLYQEDGRSIIANCSIFGVQRTTFEAALENMKKSGLITYSLKELRVTDRRRLVLMLERDAENGSEVHDQLIRIFCIRLCYDIQRYNMIIS